MSSKAKYLSIKMFLSTAIILLGNLFWIILIDTLNTTHILTSSGFQVALSLLAPIVIFTLYLSVAIIASIFIKKHLIWFLIIFLSMIDYAFLSGTGYLGIAGEIAITVALCLYLINFYKYDVLVKRKLSIVNTESAAFGTASVIISITVAVNFYNFYSHTLSSSNTLLSNQIIARSLSPVVKIYYDDINVINPDEKFGAYLKRQSTQVKQPSDQVRTKILDKLGVKGAKDDDSMKNLVKASLDSSVLKVAREYSREIPILISLSLGVITQTLLSVSSFLSGYLTIALFKILEFLKLCKKEDWQIKLTRFISTESQI